MTLPKIQSRKEVSSHRRSSFSFTGLALLLFLSLVLSSNSGHTSSTTLPQESIYDLTAHLTDQDGKQISLDTYRGNLVVVSMFYASCNYSCPLLLDALKKMDAKLTESTRKKVRVLLITFDPENDTPSVLKKLAQDHKLDLSRWKLAAPAHDEVRDIAALLDYTYRSIPTGGFNHSSSITLLDATGIPILHEEGVMNAAEAVVEKLKKDF